MLLDAAERISVDLDAAEKTFSLRSITRHTFINWISNMKSRNVQTTAISYCICHTINNNKCFSILVPVALAASTINTTKWRQENLYQTSWLIWWNHETKQGVILWDVSVNSFGTSSIRLCTLDITVSLKIWDKVFVYENLRVLWLCKEEVFVLTTIRSTKQLITQYLHSKLFVHECFAWNVCF